MNSKASHCSCLSVILSRFVCPPGDTHFLQAEEGRGTKFFTHTYFTHRGDKPCEADYGGPLPIKGPPGSLHFFIDLKTTDKLKNTAWFEVNRTFGCREIII